MVATLTDAGTPVDEVAAVRGFNRFYTRLIGVLGEGIADSPYSLAEARVLFELARAEQIEVVDLRDRLGLDAGYLSRIVARFERDGLVRRERSPHDGRRLVLGLTGEGRDAFAVLDNQAAAEIEALLAGLDPRGRRRLLAAMRTIEGLFARPGGPGQPVTSYVLRPPEPGDLGWIVERHGALYAAEYGWDDEFEAWVAQTVADYRRRRDRAREAVWIAEVDGERAGCVGCVREDDETARLRWLLVEPAARGSGIGARLVDECLRFARRSGYRRITLWTYDVLADARRLYERAGFTLDDQHPERAFGHDLTQQNWSREL
jgi:DNA-binding MarR family transcriptional regulator/N-acetylglutamate synthase-like GNAT family acetyltransferase